MRVERDGMARTRKPRNPRTLFFLGSRRVIVRPQRSQWQEESTLVQVWVGLQKQPNFPLLPGYKAEVQKGPKRSKATVSSIFSRVFDSTILNAKSFINCAHRVFILISFYRFNWARNCDESGSDSSFKGFSIPQIYSGVNSL